MSDVSVVLAAYNCEKTLEKAALSILDQTYKDLTLVIVNDGSTDKTLEVASGLLALARNKVQIISFPENRGFPHALNEGLAQAKRNGSRYIARMDGDDISHKDRIYTQVHLMDETGLYLSGTHALIEQDGKVIEHFHPMVPPGEERRWLLKFDYFIHGSTMFRTEVIDDVGNYQTDMDILEDYDLWFRIANKYPIGIIPVTLYTLIRHPQSMTSGREQHVWNESQKLRKLWSDSWGIPVPGHDLPGFRTVVI